MDLILLIVMIVLPLIAQWGVTSTFRKYSTVHNSHGLTAEQVARRILDSNGLQHIRIERVSGNLTDHFSPSENVIRLSDSVYGQTSVSAIGVASHECGHACQHAENYAPIVIRSKIVPVVNICSQLWYLVFLIGLIISEVFVYVGIAMFGAVVIFQLVTLPTEFDASNRALRTLESDGILSADEITPARKVLISAGMTYVASLVTSVMQLLRLIARAKND